MRSGLSPGNHRARRALLTGLLVCLAGQVAGSDDADYGWQPAAIPEPEPWRELDSELPAYPLQENLLDTGSGPADRRYRIYLDTESLSVGADRVVRYTVVIVSGDGVWNVTHEGLRCGDKVYRRYAYGMNGSWQDLGDTPWLPLPGDGINAYRRTFYTNYMCDSTGPDLRPEQITRKFRSRRMMLEE